MEDTLMVYTEAFNSRINYIFNHIFFRILKQDFILTTDIKEFKKHKGPKVGYFSKNICGELTIIPSGLLHEDLIKEQDIRVTDWEGTKIFFQVNGKADLPFDIFSAVFFMITRYEEYLPYFTEKLDRFEASQSIAFKNKFLDKPVVDQWIIILENKLIKKYPVLKIPESRFRFQSTIDIDNPFAFLHKGFFRTTGALLKSVLRLDLKAFISRILTLQGARKDPFETYGYINRIERKYNFESIYFFLVGDYSRYDTSIPVKKLAYQNLIVDIHGTHKIGLHSSFSSTKSFNALLEEKQRLTKVINEQITRSRQHYLMLKMPETYQKLIEAGIKEDYSMGYATELGFRAGTCNPFKFYDLSKEKEMNLMIYPFQIMEVALHNYKRLRSKDAIEPITKIIDAVNDVNGLFISLWHNESLSEYGMWIGWREVFEEMVNYAVDLVLR